MHSILQPNLDSALRLETGSSHAGNGEAAPCTDQRNTEESQSRKELLDVLFPHRQGKKPEQTNYCSCIG